MLTEITDYSQYNQPPYLAEQFRESNLVKILEAVDSQVEEIDAAAFDLITQLWIDTATGAQLDICGKHVDILRGGRDDEEYRRILKVKVAANTGSGTPEVLITVAKALFEAELIIYSPSYPGKVYIAQDGAINALLRALAGIDTEDTLGVDDGSGVEDLEYIVEDSAVISLLKDIVPAGVKLFLLQYLGFDDGTYFGLDGGDYLGIPLNNG